MMILFNKSIGPVPVEVILDENHKSSIGVTEIPIETGAKITDHSYIEPKKLDYTIADGNPVATYNALVNFQETREPFNIVSGLYLYKDMLIKDLNVKRDPKTSRILSGTVSFQQVILVGTAYTKSENGDGGTKAGEAGGDKSTKSSADSKNATNAKTADKTTGTVVRGDQASKTVEPVRNQSILSRMLK